MYHLEVSSSLTFIAHTQRIHPNSGNKMNPSSELSLERKAVTDRYDVKEAVGQGSFGDVYRASSKERPGEEVAIKILRDDVSTWSECMAVRELKSLRQFSNSHEHIVHLYEVHKEQNKLLFVFEYMPDGNLWDVLCSEALQKSRYLPPARIQSIAKQLVKALAFIHDKGYVHRDMKPENILFRGETCKVSDFGLTRLAKEDGPCTDYVATRWYRAPELLLGSQRYGKPIDMFALGCIVAELHRNRPLLPGDTELEQLDMCFALMGVPSRENWPEGLLLAERMKIHLPVLVAGPPDELARRPRQVQKAYIGDLLPQASFMALDFVQELLVLDPRRRLSANDAVMHPFLFANATSVDCHTPTTATVTPTTTRNVDSGKMSIQPLMLVTASPRMAKRGLVNTITPPEIVCVDSSEAFGSPTTVHGSTTPTNPYATNRKRKVVS